MAYAHYVYTFHSSVAIYTAILFWCTDDLHCIFIRVSVIYGQFCLSTVTCMNYLLCSSSDFLTVCTGTAYLQPFCAAGIFFKMGSNLSTLVISWHKTG